MKFFAILFACALAASALAGDTANAPRAATPKSEGKSEWVFSLLPKSLQKNPNIDLTVITEVTEAGKKYPQATPQKPQYYAAQSSGYHALGDNVRNENTVPEADVTRILEHSLATSGYLPVKADQRPSLLILYVWGSHNLMTDADADGAPISGEAVARNLLDRAALVGGEKFAKQMIELFQEAEAQSGGNITPPPVEGVAQDPVMGAGQMAFMNPVALFKQRDPKNEFLVDQAASDCFYVVASAYDYEAFIAKKRVLLWRTRMTANSRGVSQLQSLPTMITAAGPFFGKEMEGPEIIIKRAVREGQVEIGTPVVVPSSSNSAGEKK